MSRKKISQSDIIGDRGIALIHRIVGEMGFVWTPTGLEAGIDGYIEIRDPVKGEMTNLMIQVQSKATERDFQAETADGFEYVCEARDLDYWLGGNAPVILVRSRPSTDEAYWVSLKDYFKDLSTRATRKIRFDKSKDRFDVNCRESLVALARPRDSGLYLSPLPKREKLYSNLLELVSFAEKLYIAETDYRRPGDLWQQFRKMNVNVGGEWILRNKRILSFHNLEEYPWCKICDPGTIDPFDIAEWAYTDDPDRERDFVDLLNRSLRAKLWPEVRYSEAREYYLVAPTEDLSPRTWFYKSLAQQTSRDVFQIYRKKLDPTQIKYCRHSAFFGQFVRFSEAWYLEITPTYHYTRDGIRESRFREEYLKEIKRIEHNPAVLGQVVMWADYLREKLDLFTVPYPFLKFGSLVSFEVEAGLDDRVWLGQEESEDAKGAQSSPNQLSLFDLLPE